MTIRTAQDADSAALNKLLYQVHKVHSDARPDLFRCGSKKYDDEQLRNILADKDRPIFVAEENGAVCGYAFCIIQDNSKSASLADIKTLYIDDLCVDESCRGNGIGRKLYDYVCSFARKIGCYNVTLNVWAGNESAEAFYRNIGMRVQKIGMEQIL